MSDDESVFFDDWTDEKKRERFRVHSRETYDFYLREQEQAHRGHMEYAKWLFASLLAVHGGAIYAMNSLRSSVPPEKSGFLINAAACSLSGVFLTLLAGLFAWVNLQLAENLYRDLANPAMLYRSDKYGVVAGAWVDRSLYLSASFGILSGLSFALSAALVIIGLKSL